MNYALLAPHIAIRTISPEQYERLKKAGHKARGNQHKKVVIADYATYQAEQAEARAYTHAEHHKQYATCFYNGCDKAVA